MTSFKKTCLFVCLLLAFFGCETETALTFEPYSLEEGACEGCASVSVQVPRALGSTKIEKTINTAINEEIISLLHFDDPQEVSNVASAITSFTNGYKELKEKFVEESMPWKATIKGTVTYEDPLLLTIALDSYIFTGGAHGYSEVRYLNFDKKAGAELDNQDLFKDMGAFAQMAEAAFRKKERIPVGAPINSTGFMFNTETFHLPQSLGYTKEGIQLYYAPYEIASYADGAIVLTLPFKACEPFLAYSRKKD